MPIEATATPKTAMTFILRVPGLGWDPPSRETPAVSPWETASNHVPAIVRLSRANLVLLTALSWLYLAVVADAMKAMTGGGGSSNYMWLMPMGRWGATEFVLGFAMWAVFGVPHSTAVLG